MDTFTLFRYPDGIDALVRFIHILAGITWIGLLYYFNFVQAPFVAESEDAVKGAVTRGLAPRALAWFRYAALVTFLAGTTLILIRLDLAGTEVLFGTPYGFAVLTAGTLGTLMFLNVWGVIWPNQKVVIASARAVAGGGSADPRVPTATRRALLASRTNVVLSIPMLLFMVIAAHAVSAGTGENAMYWLFFGALLVLVEGNALVGLTGPTKLPLEKIGPVIISGVVLAVIVYLLFTTLGGDSPPLQTG